MAKPSFDLGFITTSVQPATQNVIIPPPTGRTPPKARLHAGRCSERGCVFPAVAPGGGRCHQHDLECREPYLFGSRQPSMLLLDRAKFGLPDSEIQARESRSSDRRRLARQWERFLEGVA